MDRRGQRRRLAALIRRADAAASRCNGEYIRCVRELRKELLYQLERRDLSRSADGRDEAIRAAEAQIARLERRLDAILDASLVEASRTAYNASAQMLGGSVVRYSRERVDAIIDALEAREGGGMATTFAFGMKKQVVTALRNATVSAFREQAVAGGSQKQLAEAIRSKWLAAVEDPRSVRFVDKAGRVWNTRNYLMMNVRTNSMAVYNDVVVDTVARTTGSDLMRISDDGGTDDSCEPCREWAGRIVSISGATEGFPTIAEARAAGVFHPNCIHTLEPVDEKLDADEIERQRGGGGG